MTGSGGTKPQSGSSVGSCSTNVMNEKNSTSKNGASNPSDLEPIEFISIDHEGADNGVKEPKESGCKKCNHCDCSRKKEESRRKSSEINPIESQHDSIQYISSDSENEVLEGKNDRRFKRNDGMKRVSGLNIWVPYNKSNDSPRVFTRMANRLRSSQTKMTSKRKNDEQEKGDSSDHHDKENDLENNNPQEENDLEETGKGMEDMSLKKKDKTIDKTIVDKIRVDNENDIETSNPQEENDLEETGRGMEDISLKKKHKTIDKTIVDKVEVDSLWDQMDISHPSVCHEQDEEESYEIPVEEPFYDSEEAEMLFEEMAFAKASEDIGSTSSNIVFEKMTGSGDTKPQSGSSVGSCSTNVMNEKNSTSKNGGSNPSDLEPIEFISIDHEGVDNGVNELKESGGKKCNHCDCSRKKEESKKKSSEINPIESQHDSIQYISSDSENEVLEGKNDRRFKRNDGMKRVSGLNILVPYNKINDSPRVFTRMADRLRSSQTKTTSKRKNDEQENGDSSDHRDKENDIQANNPQEENDLEETGKGMKDMSLKKKHKTIDKTIVDKVGVDSLWDQMDISDSSDCHEQDEEESYEIPKNFCLEEYDAKPVEEPFYDAEAEMLFEEMAFAKASEDIGSTSSNMVNHDNPQVEKEFGVSVGKLRNCGDDNHLLVLDEQIGIICKRCSYVEVEIRYISPTFATNTWKRPKGKEFRQRRNKIVINQKNFRSDKSHLEEDIIDTPGTVWGLIPGTRKGMFPHQIDGFEFIWNNIEGSILLEDLMNESSNIGGNGCIISHAPGTGKTRLTIMFIKSYLELYPTRKVVIIAPTNMLLTWEDEFKKWKVNIPFHNMNRKDFSGHEVNAAAIVVNQFRDQDKHSKRLVKLFSWKKGKSVLGMSYGLFEKLTGDGIKKSCQNQIDCFQITKMLQELPDLLVLDEGHTPRNENSLIWKALTKVQTQKRIILSGTPFQNNFRELYNTLCLVRPKFADNVKKTDGSSSSRNPRQDSKEKIAFNKWVSLTKGVAENDDDRIKEVRDIIDQMAHVYKGGILKESLPGLIDSLVVLKPTELQNSILNVIFKMKNGLEREHCVSLTSVHPSLLIHSQLKEKEEFLVYMSQLESLKTKYEEGVKTKFLIELIKLSESLNEKVLIFSQYIDPLTLIMDQLKFNLKWSEGKEILYMDGGKDTKVRQKSITSFNNSDSEAKVMLASTKACSEGISLVGASRVVLLDVVWNPSVERQAISRAYRIGQKKVVYVYHLVTGEAESTKYERQTNKDRLSKLVFCSANDNSSENGFVGTVGKDKILQEMVQHERTCHMFEKINQQEGV